MISSLNFGKVFYETHFFLIDTADIHRLRAWE